MVIHPDKKYNRGPFREIMVLLGDAARQHEVAGLRAEVQELKTEVGRLLLHQVC